MTRLLMGATLAILLSGCAHDNGIIFTPASKPPPADTIHAVGDVLGGVGHWIDHHHHHQGK